MESCFPPLAGLSLRDSSNSAKSHKNRHSTNGTPLSSQDARNNSVNSNECMPKLEVLQDLDLYYIRQIASSLKVNANKYNTHTRTHYMHEKCKYLFGTHFINSKYDRVELIEMTERERERARETVEYTYIRLH